MSNDRQFRLAPSGDWRMQNESVPHEKTDLRTALWRLTVPASGDVKLDYRVRVNR